MAKRKEQFELDQCDEYGRRLFYALLDIEENLLSESDLKWIWKDIQRRLKKTEFQKKLDSVFFARMGGKGETITRDQRKSKRNIPLDS